jgi:hypothetical protein
MHIIIVKDGLCRKHIRPRCHLDSQKLARLMRYYHISGHSRWPHVTEYSARSLLSIFRTPAPLTAPSAVHLIICVRSGFHLPGLSVRAQLFLSPPHRFAKLLILKHIFAYLSTRRAVSYCPIFFRTGEICL